VIFIYLSALIPNEIFQVEKLKILIIVAIIVVLFFTNKNTSILIRTANRTTIVRIFGHNFIKRLLPLILIYLLAGLFSVIFVCEKSKNPLKTNTYEQTKTPPYLKSSKLRLSRLSCPCEYHAFLKLWLTPGDLSYKPNCDRSILSNTL